jgi:hypothetical protein
LTDLNQASFDVGAVQCVRVLGVRGERLTESYWKRRLNQNCLAMEFTAQHVFD